MENWEMGRSFHGAVSVFGGTGMKGYSQPRTGGGRFRRKVRWAEIQCESVLDSGARFRIFACWVECVIVALFMFN